MLRTAIKGVLAHKLRLTMTGLAIILGVAFVSGSYVFTDTINARFESLFSEVYAGVDVSVRSAGDMDATTGFDDSVLATVEAVDGVETVVGGVAGSAQIIDPDGDPIGGQGPPTIGMSWIEVPALNILRIEEGNGRAPATPGEVAIDVATATAHGFEPGDVVSIQTTGGLEEFRLVGLTSFGSEDNLAGATTAAFELSEAQRLFGLEGRHTSIDMLAAEGVEAEQLVERVSEVLPSGLEAVTGDQQMQEQLDTFTDGLGFINVALLAFAGVAVLVGAFIIQNTFRIVVGQRVRELALLRAVGATGRQVTVMVALEALLVAIVASAMGVAAGVGLATVLKAAMDAAGFGMPDGPLTVAPRTVAVGMAVGITVTMAAALLPARKAATVPPVAAMRADGVGSPGRRSLRRRAIGGTVLTGVGAAGIAVALIGEASGAVTVVGAGALAVFIGVSVLAPLFARPIAAVLGSPLRGMTGTLARENTKRSPRRTAATASALMIGVALVGFVSIFAASIKASVAEATTSAFPADLSFQSTNFMMGLSPDAIDLVAGVEQVDTVSAVYGDSADVDGVALSLVGVDPSTIELVYSPEATIPIAEIGDGLVVLSDLLARHGWSVGESVDVAYPGGTMATEIVGTFDTQTLGQAIVSVDSFEAGFGEREPFIAFARLGDGVEIADGKAATEAALADFPNVKVNTKSDQVAQAEAQIDMMVALFTGLLGLAVVIAVLGIANTLALSIVERTREIGLLRAVGMNRPQVRRMIRWESVIIAGFGSILGLAVGSALGWSVVVSLADDGLGSFTLPVSQLGAWLLVGALAGVVAAILPARKAARLDVLEAIAYQ